MAKELMKGNVAIAEAAIRAGCEAYFGYPITPQTELLEHMAWRMPALGRVFLQAESEVAAVNMVYGAASTGRRVMSSSSSPGFSLMQEGFSYIAGSEIPAVVVDVMRGGPGLGNIQPTQGDYFQVTRSAGHGDFHPIVLAPASVQEAIDLTVLAFDLAEQYRHLTFVVLDGLVGQMMEPAELPPMREMCPHPDAEAWALTGAQGRAPNVVHSLYMGAENCEHFNLRLQERLKLIKANEQRSYEAFTEGADVIVVGYGTAGRIAESAVRIARDAGMKVGLFRPITLWPFPEKRLSALADEACAFLVVEMNAGQMVDDVRIATGCQVPVEFYGRMGGVVPMPEEIYDAITEVFQKFEDSMIPVCD
ncbi:MAG: 3-methyl-2-oxobutanoate dehydrogenase subunit VorB [Anaerolineae bacterium]|nr:3-methyl-2-oxobutanoate dehydrogenase subunit VorB [Anaerolineae bacterium]